MNPETETVSAPMQPQATETPAATAAVNDGISSLANYRARIGASSAPAPAQDQQVGEATPDSGADTREQAIPRQRFDEVLNERNDVRSQLQQAQGQLMALQQQQLSMMQPVPATPQGPTTVGGMQGAAPPVPDFTNPDVQRQWRDKIANDPVVGLHEFVSLLIRAEGAPLLEQFQQQITGQFTPMQRAFVQQQVGSYETNRTQTDPGFSQIAPAFRALVDQASQRGYTLDTPTLQAIEGIARAQAGIPFGAVPPQAPAPTPFSERPGGAANFGQTPTPSLTSQQRAIAQRFGMTDQEYSRWNASNGVY